MKKRIWVKANEIESVNCAAVLWAGDFVLDTMSYHNEAQLAPFLRSALERGATRLECIDDRDVIFDTFDGQNIIVALTEAEKCLAYHMVKQGLSEEAALAYVAK